MNELALATRRATDVLERSKHVDVLGIDPQRLGEGVLGAPRVLQLVAAPAGEPHPQVRAGRGRHLFRGSVQCATERIGRFCPCPVRRRQPLELLQRFVVGRVLDDGCLDRALGPAPIPHTLLEHTRQRQARMSLVASRSGAGHPALVELCQLLAQAQRAEHELQRVEGVVE